MTPKVSEMKHQSEVIRVLGIGVGASDRPLAF
jgi:hypothetical protein